MRLTDFFHIIITSIRFEKTTRCAHSLFSFLLLLALAVPVFGKSIEEQRKDYLAAKKALDTKQYKTFGKIANTLKAWRLAYG